MGLNRRRCVVTQRRKSSIYPGLQVQTVIEEYVTFLHPDYICSGRLILMNGNVRWRHQFHVDSVPADSGDQLANVIC